MPEKFKEKALFMIMNLLGTLAIMFIVLATTGRLGKADVTYVDKQDNAIKSNFVEYKQDHQIQHSNEYKLMKAEVEAVKSNQVIMMQFWNIPQLAADK
jgi:hypothetical protein